MAECIRGWLKDLGPLAASIAVILVTISFNRWQRRLAKAQLRNQLYDRRVAIYSAFRELLIALPEEGEEEIRALFRRVSIARFEVPFLFEADQGLQAYLDQLNERVTREVIKNIVSPGELRQVTHKDPAVVRDISRMAAQLGIARLEIPSEHLPRLSQEFGPFLSLTDLKH